MTIQEAIKQIKEDMCTGKGSALFCRDSCMYGKNKCAYEMAIEALKKQAGIERTLERLEDYNMWKELLIYDLTYREREIVKKAIEIIKEEVG